MLATCKLTALLLNKKIWKWSTQDIRMKRNYWTIVELHENNIAISLIHYTHNEVINFMEQSPWKCLSDVKEIHLSWNPKVHYHVHKTSLLNLILSQLNLTTSSQSYFLKIQFNIVLSKPMSPKQFLQCRFSDYNTVFISISCVLQVLPISHSLIWSPW
jgi:hypothetical protein